MLGNYARRDILARIEWVASRPQCWGELLDSLVRLTGYAVGQVVRIDTNDSRRNRMLVDMDHAGVAEYNRHFGKYDPLTAAVRRVPVGHVFSSRTHFLNPEHRKSAFFADWCERNGCGDSIFMPLVRRGAEVDVLELARPWREPLVDDRPARRLIESLYGPLTWAGERARFRSEEAESRHAALEVLGAGGTGCLLLEPGLRVADSNRLVREMLEAEDGWSFDGERLHLPGDVHQALEVMPFDGPGSDATILLPRPTGLRPYMLQFVPGDLVVEGANWRLRALLVIDPERSDVDRCH